jgi:beta-phosphoglucomutase-like phosphatase (HAD superfamily)
MPSTLEMEIEVGGILFDMDGVLVRSTSGDVRCWTRWADRQQLTDRFDLTRTHGRRAVDTIREHLPHVTDDELRQHLADLIRWRKRSSPGSRLTPEHASFSVPFRRIAEAL